MKTKTKVIALLLTAIMIVSLFAGCTGDAESNTPSSKTETSTPAGDTSSGESSPPVPAETGEFQLPICEEKTTVTMWTIMDSNITNLVNSLGETDFFKELEERTNVHIEFDIPATGGESQAFNLLFSSGELPDMIKYQRPGYPGGTDAAIDDGFYLDLTDLIPQYAPHYYKVLRSQPESAVLSAYTAKGRLGEICQIMQTTQGPWAGLYVRQDWLDKCNLETPVTYEDWETMLTAFKDQCGATAPLLLHKNGYDAVFHTLSAGYGVTAGFHHENGVVKYGPAEEGWKKYVTTMHGWYEKGLIDPDFMASSSPVSFLPDQAMITTGKTGAFDAMYTMVSVYEAASTDNAVLTPVYPPMETAGMKNEFIGLPAISGGIAISAKSDKAEICLKLLDYLFTEEGALFANYGIEGDTFEFVDGKPQYTEKVTANPDGMTFGQCMAFYTMPAARVCWQDWTRETASVPEKDLVSYDIWGDATDAKSIPTVSAMNLDTDTATEYSKIMADVETIRDEKTAQFISGVVSLDEFDAYVESLKSVGLDRAIEIMQEGYENFLNKKID